MFWLNMQSDKMSEYSMILYPEIEKFPPSENRVKNPASDFPYQK